MNIARNFVKAALASAIIFHPVSSAVAQDTEIETRTPATRGINHIGLTVRDLEASADFFVDALGWRRAGGFPDYPSIFVTDGELFVTLWQATDPATAVPFNRKTNVGLHHLALTVPDIEMLDELYATFQNWPGVEIEFGPEPNGGGPTIHMIIREPSGNRLEFAVPGGSSRDTLADN